MRPPQHVDLHEAATLVGRTHWAVRKWITRGLIPAVTTDTGTIVVHGPTLLQVEATLYRRQRGTGE